MNTIKNLKVVESNGASEEFYGDSDADENPFEHSSAHGVEAFAPASLDAQPISGDVLAGAEPGERFSFSTTTASAKSSSSLPVGQLPQDHRRRFPQASGPLTFPAIVGQNNSFITSDLRPRARVAAAVTSVDMEDTEVETETETEGETENEDDKVTYPAYSATAADGALEMAVERSTKEEREWENRIGRQVRNARAGKTDPPAMRRLLQKAGFVPASLRKDVWRLLILGRVDAGVGGSTAAEAGIAQRDVLELDAAILSTELDLDNQRVVRVDVERTRPALEQFKRPRVKNMLARVLTHHCKTYGVGYKQGMHEVLAPFVALSDPELPTSDISLSYGAFIKRFLPYAFNKDEEFISLQICFRLFRILLLYHHPRLCRFLDQYQLQPELYATPWFMTLFASSLDLPRLYEVWDFYLYWGDPALHHFVVLAFVMGNADVILKAEEANLPETMCRLSVGMRSVAEVRTLVRAAKALMLNTPKSFRKILRSSLYANLSQSQMNLVLNTLQVSSCIPVSAEEVISYILHKNPHRQLDQESDQEGSEAFESMNAFDGHPWQASSPPMPMSPPPARGGFEGADRNARPTSPQRVAERAAMRSLRVHRQYIIMDCRPKHEFEACRLAPALHLDPDLLDSPDDLDAKLKEFNPLQGAVHFCLVGAGGDSSADRQRKNNATFDLSGEAMGLLPTSTSKGDFFTRLAASPGRGGSSRSDREGDAGEKDGGFNWMGGFSKALAGRSHGAVGGREEGEVGREEDVQVARFVLMLLQYNFPYISHVRGDMSACLRELSTQALDEVDEKNVPNGDYHETLHGLLIGSDADRMREELTRCSPEKKSEGLLAGLAKWTKDKGDWKGDSANDAAGGLDGSEGRTRVPSWIGSWDSQATAADRGDVGGKAKRVTEVDATKPQDHHAPDPKVSTKRGLFGSVLHRFEKSADAAAARRSGRGDGGNVTEGINIVESPLPKDESSTPSNSLRWLKTPSTATTAPPEADSAVTAAAAGSMPATFGDKTSSSKVDAAAAATAGAAAPFPDAPHASGTTTSAAEVAQDNPTGAVRKASGKGTWVKPRKGGPPDRLARFFGKVLGVRDDALPDETLPTVGGNGIVSSADTLDVNAEGAERAGGALGRVESGGEIASPSAGGVQEERTPLSDSLRALSSGNDPIAAAATAAAATDSTVDTASADISSADSAGATSTAAATACATSTNSETTTVTATAVYPTTTATVDALPVAVAVAIPVVEGGGTGSNPSRPARRQSRNRGSRGAAGGAGARAGAVATVERRQEEEAAAAAPAGGGRSEAVLISQWVGREERESGGSVKIFSAQRVLEGKVRKRCRLAVSPKKMVQFDNIQQSDRGARGVISENRGLHHLSRITSRKKHADLLVFHFKSSSDAAGGSGATGSSFGSAGAVSASSRRSRLRTTSENDPGQPDVLFYLLKEHVECLRMVKENYRKVTHGSVRSGDGRNGGGNSDAASNRSIAALNPRSIPVPTPRGDTSGQDSRLRTSPNSLDEQRSSRAGRQAVRAAGAVAGATGLVVGATAGVAVGAAAGVAAGAAFLVGHRKGVREELMPRSTSPSRPRRRGSAASGGSDGGDRSNARANASTDVELRRDSGGWIPIDAPGGWIPIERQVETRPRRTDVSGGIGGGSRPSAVNGGLRPSSLTRNPRSQTGISQGQGQRRSARGGGATGGASKGRGAADGPTWLDRG